MIPEEYKAAELKTKFYIRKINAEKEKVEKENKALWRVVKIQLVILVILACMILSAQIWYKTIRSDLEVIKTQLNGIQLLKTSEPFEILEQSTWEDKQKNK